MILIIFFVGIPIYLLFVGIHLNKIDKSHAEIKEELKELKAIIKGKKKSESEE